MNNFTPIESVFYQIMNVLPDGIIWLEPLLDEKITGKINDYKLQFINASACSLLNVSEDAVLGRHVIADNLLHDKTIQAVLLAQSPATQTFYEEQMQQWLRIDKQHINAGYIIRISDVTQSKAQQQHIEKLTEKQQQAIETSLAGTFYTGPIRDEDGKIVDWVFNTANQMIASFVDLKPEELIGQLGSKWFPSYMTDGLFDLYLEVFTTGKSMRFDYHYYEEGKLDIWVDFMVTKYGDELLVTLTDFTTIKKLQLQLEAYVHELKRSNESLEQFAYAASHDLQAPLRNISLYIEKLEEKYADVLDDSGYSYIERIKTVTKRMRRLIQDLLVFAEVGSIHATIESIDLTQLVQEVVSDLEGAIEERNGKVQVGPLGAIRGNSIHLQQLFQNLIGNALKYSKIDVAPYITITAELVSGVPIDLPEEIQSSYRQYLRIQVKDNGQGFSNEQAKQMFKIFQRLPQHRHETTGSGIGLAIVQRVVENHKGYIIAEGVPHVGATFSIYFPVEGFLSFVI